MAIPGLPLHVNKQANAGLQRIKGHIMYMHESQRTLCIMDNCFLKVQNKQSKLDLVIVNLYVHIFTPILSTFGC